MITPVDIGIAILLLGLAVWTAFARAAFAAVAGFIAYGLLLALVWVRLNAHDVALTEAAIGGGLTGALLISAAARMRRIEQATNTERTGLPVRLLAIAASAGVALALSVCVLVLPDPAPSLAHPTVLNQEATGVGNPVTAVLLAFRAIDTLLEAIVLLIALIGVWSLAPERAWGGRPGPRQVADPNGKLAWLARVLAPIGLVAGFYVFWVGADFPGGKFQGATIIASMWLLAQMAGLAEVPPIGRTWLRVGLVAGPLIFIAIGLAGTVTAGAFLAYPVPFAKPLIIAIEMALLPTLVLVLGLLLAGTPAQELSK